MQSTEHKLIGRSKRFIVVIVKLWTIPEFTNMYVSDVTVGNFLSVLFWGFLVVLVKCVKVSMVHSRIVSMLIRRLEGKPNTTQKLNIEPH